MTVPGIVSQRSEFQIWKGCHTINQTNLGKDCNTNQQKKINRRDHPQVERVPSKAFQKNTLGKINN